MGMSIILINIVIVRSEQRNNRGEAQKDRARMGGGCVPGDGTIACIGLIHSIGAGMRKGKKKKEKGPL
jgi:hypothetical protein